MSGTRNWSKSLLLLCLFLATAAQAESALVFDTVTKSWIRKQGITVAPKVARSDKSPIAREIVPFDRHYKVGTIIIETSERRLYRVDGNGIAVRYAIGVGREGFAWKGNERISQKAEWPSWTPPSEMRKRELANGRTLPSQMDGGPNNPLGARALYLGNTLYRIHGTNQPWTIGQAVSSGCIRMANEDVIHLFSMAKIGDLVVVR